MSAVCPACSRPIPPELTPLPALVLEQLDRDGPTSARQLAKQLGRRQVDVRNALHELRAAGLVVLEQPTNSARSQRWAGTAAELLGGRAWDAHESGSEPPHGFADAGALVALLAALTSSGGWTRRLTLGVALGLLLVLVGAAMGGQSRA